MSAAQGAVMLGAQKITALSQASAEGEAAGGPLRDRRGKIVLLAENGADPDAGAIPDVPQDMGGSQECEDLLDKIQDRVNELKKRAADLKENKLNLPEKGEMSIQGHQQQFENKQANLRSMLDEWNSSGCGSGLPADAWSIATAPTPSPAVVPASSAFQNALTAGTAIYIIYRGVRMLPSLTPLTWPSIPANALVP
jgi:hypothetical protein